MRKTITLLILYILLSVVIYNTDNDIVKMILLFVVTLSAVFSKKINEILVFNGVSLVLGSFSSPIPWIIASAPLFINKNLVNALSRYVNYLIPFLFFSFLSYVFGQGSELNTMLVLYMAIFLFILVLDRKISLKEVWTYSLFSLIILVSILVFESINGGIELKYGRLNLDGSIRTVANCAAFPTFISWSLLFSKEEIRNKIFVIITGVVSTTILLLTISKGAIIAVVIGIVFSAFSFGKRKNLFIMALIVAIVYYLYSHYLVSLDDYHFDRLTDEYDGFSGRTDLWNGLWNHYIESGRTIILGFGPGDLKRFSFANDMYAHSLFLDLLYSFGVLMSLLYLIVIVKIVVKIVKTKMAIPLGLVFFTILLYSTHGVSNAFQFYIYLGLSYAISENYSLNKKENYSKI